MSKVVIIGSTNTDMMVRSQQMPIPGETILGKGFYMNSGGKGANQAVAVSRLGGEAIFVTKIGRDIFGFEFLKTIKEEGMATEYINFHKSKPTGVALITVSDHAENAIVVAPGANGTLKKKEVNLALDEIKAADVLLVQLETPMKILHHVVALAKQHKKRLIVNPAPAVALADEVYENLFAITPNETEAEILTGIPVVDVESAQKAAQLLRAKGVQHVIITMGAKGAYICSDELTGLVPGFQVDAKDTTAAGDTFNGALAVALGKGMPMEEAIVFANKAASFTVKHYGAQATIPFLSELEEIASNTEANENESNDVIPS